MHRDNETATFDETEELKRLAQADGPSGAMCEPAHTRALSTLAAEEKVAVLRLFN